MRAMRCSRAGAGGSVLTVAAGKGSAGGSDCCGAHRICAEVTNAHGHQRARRRAAEVDHAGAAVSANRPTCLVHRNRRLPGEAESQTAQRQLSGETVMHWILMGVTIALAVAVGHSIAPKVGPAAHLIGRAVRAVSRAIWWVVCSCSVSAPCGSGRCSLRSGADRANARSTAIISSCAATSPQSIAANFLWEKIANGWVESAHRGPDTLSF
jgi:hypothetical protein